MSNDITTKHSDESIIFNPHTEKWVCSRWDYANVSLKKVKDHIDKKQKQERGEFRRRKVLFCRYLEDCIEAEVTSIDDGGECWLTYAYNGEKRRSKEKMAHVMGMRDDYQEHLKEQRRLDSVASDALKAARDFQRSYIKSLIPEDFSK